MNLKELKQMIKEEFEAFTEADDVSVDVDAEEMAADKNPEDTLKKVFDMLKDYFEGDEENMEDEMEEDMMEAKDDDDKKMEEVKDEDAKNEEADLEERAAQGFGDPGAKNTSGKDVGFTPAKTTKGSTGYDGSSKALQERFQKLANIIK
tara:strand:- start:447 stop:893 length:447 start_codon:yes stop_codon:yes gene_type:complete